MRTVPRLSWRCSGQLRISLVMKEMEHIRTSCTRWKSAWISSVHLRLHPKYSLHVETALVEQIALFCPCFLFRQGRGEFPQIVKSCTNTVQFPHEWQYRSNTVQFPYETSVKLFAITISILKCLCLPPCICRLYKPGMKPAVSAELPRGCGRLVRSLWRC